MGVGGRGIVLQSEGTREKEERCYDTSEMFLAFA